MIIDQLKSVVNCIVENVSPLHFNTWKIFVFHATGHNHNWPVVTNPSIEKYFVFQYLALLVNEIPPPDELTHHSYLHLPSFVHIFLYHHLYISAKLDWGFHSLKCFLHWKLWRGGPRSKWKVTSEKQTQFPLSHLSKSILCYQYKCPSIQIQTLPLSTLLSTHPSVLVAQNRRHSDDGHEVPARL